MRSSPHWLKPLLFVICLLPALGVGYRALAGSLGINPVESLHHTFGDWTLRFLIVTLLITPLRLIPGMSWLSRLRRMVGLYAFFYASLHVAVYIMLDQQFDWPEIRDDIAKRPYITFGLSAYLLMVPLAVTSNATMKRWLGNNWKRLHQFIYLITTLGILHFFLLVKADSREPWFYLAIFAVLLVLRVVLAGRKVANHRERLAENQHSED